MFFVGISGGSGSGKTTFSNELFSGLKTKRAVLLRQESYYCSNPPAHLRIHGEPNFDHPDGFDWDLFLSHLLRLKNREKIQIPLYDFGLNKRMDQMIEVEPQEIVIVEGLLLFWHPEVRSLFDLKIFLDVDPDVRFIRRLHRDIQERMRTLDNIIRQYLDIVRPMHQIYLEPTKKYASIVIDEEIDVAVDLVLARIHQLLLLPRTVDV